MSRKLTVDVEVIDPRNGDNFGYKVYNDGEPLIFTQSGYPDSNGWNKTYVTGTTSQVMQCNRFLKLNSDLEVQESNININNGVINDLVYINDENILLVGQFNNFNTTSCNNVIKTDILGLTFSTFENGFSDAVFTLKRITRPTSQSPLGTMLFGGDFTSYKTTPINRLIKTDINGSRNNSFISQIMSAATLKGFNNRVYDIDEQPSGHIIAVGDFTNFNGNSRNRIVKLNSHGTITSFNIGTGFAASTSSPVSCVRCDGTKIYVGGGFTSYNNVLKPYIIKLNDDGSPDDTFSPDVSLNGSVLSIEINSSSQVFIGGSFTKGLARLNSNGSIDDTFNIGTGFQRTGGAMKVSSIAHDASGNIYVGGDFDSFNGQPCLNFVKLNSSGVLISQLDLNYQVIGDDVVKVIKLDSSGNVYIGGSFTNYRLENDISAIGDLYNIPLPDSIDIDYGLGFYNIIGGTVSYSSAGAISVVSNPIEDNNLFFGRYDYYNGQLSNSLSKIDKEGNLITGATGPTYLLSNVPTLLNDGTMIYGQRYPGTFSIINGYSSDDYSHLIKLDNDFNIDMSFNSGGATGFNGDFDYIVSNEYVDADNNIYLKLQGDGVWEYRGEYHFSQYGGNYLKIQSNGEFIEWGQYGRSFDNIIFCQNGDKIITNIISGPTSIKLQREGVINFQENIYCDVIELSNGNLLVYGNYISSYLLSNFSVIGNSFAIFDPTMTNLISYNSGTGILEDSSSVPFSLKRDLFDRFYVIIQSEISQFDPTYNDNVVGKLFRINDDFTIDNDFTFNNNFNNTITDILFESSYILVVGFFNQLNGESISNGIATLDYSGNKVVNAIDIAQTIQNTYDNLVEFNSGYGITYSIVSNKVRMEYEFEDDEIVIEDVFDVPYHVELDVTNESITINERINEIVTRSDHKIQTKETGTFSYTNFKIRIYEGSLFSGVTASPVKYNITKPKIVSTQKNVYIDVSNLIKEDFEWNIGYFYSNDITNAADLPENISKWVYIEETNYLGTASVSLEKHYLYAIDGYLLNNEIQHLPNLLVNGSKRYVHRDQQQRIYFQTNFLTGIQVIPEVGFSYTPSFDVNTSLNNTRYVQSLSIDKPVGARYIDYIFTYTDSVEAVRYYFYGEFGNCGKEYQELIFKNKWGVLESLAVAKKSKTNLNSIGEDYTRSIVDYNGNYDVTRHTNRKFDVDMEESFILNTDVLPEYMTDSIIDLYVSDEVWLKNDNGYTPVVVDGSVNDLKRRIDGPISYNIKVNASHRKIKNIL